MSGQDVHERQVMMSVYVCAVCGGEVDGDASVILAGEHPGEYCYEPFFEDLRTDITRVMHSECFARQQGVGALVDAIHTFYIKERSGVRKLNEEIGRLRRQAEGRERSGTRPSSRAESVDSAAVAHSCCAICSAEIEGDASSIAAFADPEEYSYMPFPEDLRTTGTRLMHPECFARDHGVRALVDVIHARDRKERNDLWPLIDERDRLQRIVGDNR
jgi:hypothetical protein